MSEPSPESSDRLSGDPAPTPETSAPLKGITPPTIDQPSNPNDGVVGPRIFEPALAHLASAFRPGDPKFTDLETARRWSKIRRVVADHVLRRIAESSSGNQLILRGSRLLKSWIGDQAREPGDLDWVADLSPSTESEPDPDSLFESLAEAVYAGQDPKGVSFPRDCMTGEAIWTYDRTPGRRAVFPWEAANLPAGTVQVDVTFGEILADPDSRIAIPVSDGGCVSVRAASPAQSLAWKLLWLRTDEDPKGKDLYDAVLLAERFPLPIEILEETLREVGEDWLPSTAAEFLGDWTIDIDWENFQAEYPWVVGSGGEWLKRLEVAIGPTFGELGSADRVQADPDSFDPSWLTTNVVEVARGIADDLAWERLPILSDALQEAGCDRAEIIDHCLSQGPHTRGCWVVDRILRKPANSEREA